MRDAQMRPRLARRRPRGREGAGWWPMGWLLGGAILLGGCGDSGPSAPPFKPPPPLSTGQAPAAQTAVLSGFVYVAELPTLDGLWPTGYRLLPGDEGKVTVRIPGTPGQVRVVPIVNGAYEVPDLPIGVRLDVTAVSPGYAASQRQVVIRLPAGRRLSFDYQPDGTTTYLLRLKDVQD